MFAYGEYLKLWDQAGVAEMALSQALPGLALPVARAGAGRNGVLLGLQKQKLKIILKT